MKREIYKEYDLSCQVEEKRDAIFPTFFIESKIGKIVLHSIFAEQVALAILKQQFRSRRINDETVKTLQNLSEEYTKNQA